MTELSAHDSILRPLVQHWYSQFDAARDAKKPFNEIAKQCDAFVTRSSGFMWKPDFLRKYVGTGIEPPKFQITINKAFELITIFGPYLFWKYPNVFIKSEKPISVPPVLLGGAGDEQQQQQAVMQQQQEDAQTLAISEYRNSLMERVLNYTQREVPGGGLAVHAELGITEALVKGRSCLWVEGYSHPGSGRKLTGRFYDSVDNLLVDPDAEDPTLRDAAWISRKHLTHYAELERRFRLPKGTLEQRGQYETANSLATDRGASARAHRKAGDTDDLVEWYEVWSKRGVATRHRYLDEPGQSLSRELHDSFDETVGDYAYLCISHAVPWPLNCPGNWVGDMSDDDIRNAFEWRAGNYGPKFQCYTDSRWPVALLDFHRIYRQAWPIAPLGPALGELTCLNILVSAFIEQAYDNRKTVIGYLEESAKDVEQAIRGTDSPAFVKIRESAQRSISDVIQYMKRPEMNNDIISAIQYVMQLFDKRTGLSEIMYAQNVGNVQSRTARDVAAKEEKASIRPEKMAGDVARWMTESADLEKFLAGWTLEGNDLIPLLGKYGAYFWDQLIASEDPEVFVREMKATVQAGDIRKPNKERLASNMQQMSGYMLPLLQAYSEATGETGPLNAFLDTMGSSIEQDTSEWRLDQWRPQPSEEEQQAQQQQQQMEQAKVQADLAIKQMEAQVKGAELEQKKVETQQESMETQAEMASKQMEMMFDAMKHKQDLGQDDEKFDQDLSQDQIKFLQDMFQKRIENKAKIEQMRREGNIRVAGKRSQA